jgi:WD40 repeat protein
MNNRMRLMWIWMALLLPTRSEAQEAKLEKSRRTVVKQSTSVEDVAFSSDGQLLAWCTAEPREVVLWSAKSSKEIRRIDVAGKPRALAFSLKGDVLAIACGMKGFLLWNHEKGELVANKLPGYCLAVAFSPNGAFLATSYDNHASLWDASTGDHIRMVSSPAREITSMAFSKSSDRFAVGDSDGTVTILDPKTGELLRTIDVKASVNMVEFDPRRDQVVIATYRSIAIRSLTAQEEIFHRDGLSFLTSFAIIGPDQIVISVHDVEKRVYWFKRSHDALVSEKTRLSARVVRVSPDGKLLAVGFGSPYAPDERDDTLGGLEIWTLNRE